MLRTFRHFIADFATQTGRYGLYGLFLSFAGALTDGIGFLFVLPILQIATGDTNSAWAKAPLSVLNHLGFTTTSSQIISFLIGFLVLMLLRSYLAWRRAIVLADLSHGFVDGWRMRVFKTMARARWPQLLDMRRHEGQHALLQDVSRLAAGSNQLLRGSVAIIFILVQLIVSAVISPALTAVVILILLGASVCLPFVLRLSRHSGRRQTLLGAAMHETLAQFSGALKLIKVHRDESIYEEAFDNKVASVRKEKLRFAGQKALSQAALQIITALLMCAVVAIGLLVFDVPTLSLIAFVIILSRISGPLFSLFSGAQVMANMLPAYEALAEFTSKLESTNTTVSTAAKSDSTVKPISVTFNKVAFSYQGTHKTEIDNLNFHIQAGQLVALVGPSGAGKTTVLDLMTGLLLPSEGDITLDEKKMASEADWTFISNGIGFVPQEPFLLDISLHNNLVGSTTNPSQTLIDHALRVCGADSIIDRLPDGLQTRAGERGQNLSGGERQRICLARALIRNPGLLILDEATAALDRESEETILRALYSLKDRPTIVIVTHRELDQSLFDQVIQLEPSVTQHHA